MKRRTLAAVPALALLGTSAPAVAAEPTPIEPPAAEPIAEPIAEPVVAPVAEPVAGGFESPGVLTGNLPAGYERLLAELTFPLAWGRAPQRDFGAWRRAARAKVTELLCQPVDHTPFRPEIVDEQVGDAVIRRSIVFNVTRYSPVRASLLVPAGPGPFPAALLLHDHGAKFDIGKEKLIAPLGDETRLASATAWAAKYFSGRFVGDELAARGYVVLAVDSLGWGDRSGLTYDGQQALASNLFNLGSSLAGLIAAEDVRAAALLASLPMVDRRRIAAVGFSMGGYRAWQVAALSDQVAATVSACWMTTLAAMMVPGNNTLRGQSAYCMLHPGLYRHLDIPDVASLAAPRPMLLFDGETDPLFTPAGVQGAYDRMAEVWRSQRAGDRLHTRIWPGLGHIFTSEMQDAAFAWLDDQLPAPHRP